MLPIQSDVIDVGVTPNPFDGHRLKAIAHEGESIAEMIACQGLRSDGAYSVLVTINGELVPERMHHLVKPKAGTFVVLRVVPRGGGDGKQILSILLSIVMVAASFFTPGVGILSAGLWTTEGLLAAGVALGGIMGIASGVQNLMAPPPAVPFSGDVPTSKDSAALTGTKNTARLYAPIRTVLGQYRVYPDLMAKPFVEQVGKDAVLRMLLCFGYGPLDITDIKIGEVPITDLIPSSKFNVLSGWDDDPELTIFRDNVIPDDSFTPELKRSDGTDLAEQGIPVPAILSTKPGPEEISFDLQFGAGLIAFDDLGTPKEVTVRFSVQEREQGTSSWNNIGDPSMGLDYGRNTDTGFTKVSAGLFELTLAERGLVSRGLRWTVPAGSTPDAVHEVKIERISTVSEVTKAASIVSDCTVRVIRTIKPHVGSTIPNLAKIELEINASETGLSGVLDNLSATCTSIAPIYNTATKTWGPTHGPSSILNQSMFKTRNAAWLFANVLRGKANSRPTPDSRIDGVSLATWAGHLDGTGDYATSGTFNLARCIDAVIDFSSTTRAVLSDIAGAGRASLNIIDGKYGVVEDVPRTQVIQHFTPRNSWGFGGAKSFRKKPHGIRTHFANPEKAYQRDELLVYDDGYNLDGTDGKTAATEFSELSLWGVADADQAWRDARYHMASSRLRPEIFTLSVDVENIVVNRGDLCRISHDVIGAGYGGARLKNCAAAGGNFLAGTMDEEFYFDASKSYAIRIRKKDGEDLLVPLVNQGQTSDRIQVEGGPIAHGATAPEVGDLLLFGERETESLLCMVQRISPRNDLTARLELVEYNAAVYTADEEIPIHTSNISLQNQPTLIPPVTPEIVGDPISDETAMTFTSSGSPEICILLCVVTPQNYTGKYSPTTHYHAQFRMKKGEAAVTDWINVPRVEATGDTKIIVKPLEEGQYYDVRVRAISDRAATVSDWVYVINHKVIGTTTPPPAPTSLSVWGSAMRWQYLDKPRDFAGFVIKHQSGVDATWATGISLSENIITDNWVSIEGRIPPGETTIMIRAIDLGGNLSETLSAVRTIKDPELLSVVAESVWTNAYAGTKTNCTFNSSSTHLEADLESTSLFYNGTDGASFWSATPSSDFWGVDIYKTMTYKQGYFLNDAYDANWPDNDHLPGRQRFLTLDIEGAEYSVEYRTLIEFVYTPGIGVTALYDEYKPWPGIRELQKTEQSAFGQTYESTEIKIEIKGGRTRGKIKAAHLITEALPKSKRVQISVSASGTTIDLTGDLWRKITNVTITPTNSSNSAQGSKNGEAYNLEAAQTATAPYELTGPTVRLYDSNGNATTGTASVLIEGY